jgi:hypothetical protein
MRAGSSFANFAQGGWLAVPKIFDIYRESEWWARENAEWLARENVFMVRP